MTLIDGMISTGRLSDFVEEMVSIRNEEEEEKILYEVWLHKIFDKSFAEFRESVGTNNKTAAPTQEDIAETVRGSKELLNSFNPLCGGAEDGTVQTSGDSSG